MRSTVNSGIRVEGDADVQTPEYTPLSPCTTEEGVAMTILGGWSGKAVKVVTSEAGMLQAEELELQRP